LLLVVVEVELVILLIATVVAAVVLVVMPLALIQYLLDHHIRLLLVLEDVEQLTLAHHMVEILEALLALILLVGLVVAVVDLLVIQQVDLVEVCPVVPVVVVELVLMQVEVLADLEAQEEMQVALVDLLLTLAAGVVVPVLPVQMDHLVLMVV
jgi:hypothetical protein